MSSSACKGLQSCLEPRFFEPNILMHNLSPPISNHFNSFPFLEEKPQEKEQNISQTENNSCIGNCNNLYDNGENLGGWSFIHTFRHTSNNIKQGKTETEQPYIHSLVKKNSSTLSSKSLEMCTESLGSETGSDISENNDVFGSMLTETDNFYVPQRSKPRKITKKFNHKVEFPPPLTSISGIDRVQVRPQRVGGRLVLEAVTLPPCNAYFQAERVDGRLRLSFMKGNNAEYDNEQSDVDEEDIEKLEEEYNVVEEVKCNCKDIDDGENDDGSSSSSDEEIRRKNAEKIGCEIEVGELQWMRRCKGGNRKGMTSCFETYCMAIS
ncbi:hypothetical protein Leryth_000604 [Lithospermum erythrorhizon]|nr:hypothetical protein Leryth_000604 [Lithospermum erythrorhizon]